MAESPELAVLSGRICGTIDRLMACLDEIGDAEARRRPPVPEANSLLVLAMHTMGSTEERILQTICGRPVERVRDQEFVDENHSAAEVRARWQTLRPQLAEALAALPASSLDEPRTRPGWGTQTVREYLLHVLQHNSEHLGQAELTRDWLKAQAAPAGR